MGEPTLIDIAKELSKPGRDPRDELPAPILRKDVLEMKDLKPGMVLSGTVRNVIDFGVFVDIGVHQDGLVHISQVCDRRLKHPSEAVQVGDVVDVVVLDVDEERRRVSLTKRQAKMKVYAVILSEHRESKDPVNRITRESLSTLPGLSRRGIHPSLSRTRAYKYISLLES